MVRKEADAKSPGPQCNFLSGGFTFSGMSGIRSATNDHEWVTKYLCSYLSRHTLVPFAGVGLALNVDHELHRDLHNQRGVPNVVLPIVSSGGGLWVQDKPGAQNDPPPGSIAEVRQLKGGSEVQGYVYQYQSHRPVVFHPHVWHESIKSDGPQLLLFGYTARGLHKLGRDDRQRLWNLGFTFLPASKTEHWEHSPSLGTVTRCHPVPRRAMFAPTDQDFLPFDRSLLGDLRLCVQYFPGHDSVQTLHNWRRGRGKASKVAWTGRSIFQLRSSAPSCASDGGGSGPSKIVARWKGDSR